MNKEKIFFLILIIEVRNRSRTLSDIWDVYQIFKNGSSVLRLLPTKKNHKHQLKRDDKVVLMHRIKKITFHMQFKSINITKTLPRMKTSISSTLLHIKMQIDQTQILASHWKKTEAYQIKLLHTKSHSFKFPQIHQQHDIETNIENNWCNPMKKWCTKKINTRNIVSTKTNSFFPTTALFKNR